MRVVLDSNILYSAFFFPHGRVKLLLDFIVIHHEVLLPQYCVDEIIGVTQIKSPQNLPALLEFLEGLPIQVPGAVDSAGHEVRLIRDAKDQPILGAAIAVDADVLLTGDKDFLNINLKRPRIMSPTMFSNEFISEETD